jgi:hypothetical protein
MIFKMLDGTRVRTTALPFTEDGRYSTEFETYTFDEDGVKVDLGIEILYDAEAIQRVNKLTVADGLRIISEYGMGGQHL